MEDGELKQLLHELGLLYPQFDICTSQVAGSMLYLADSVPLIDVLASKAFWVALIASADLAVADKPNVTSVKYRHVIITGRNY